MTFPTNHNPTRKMTNETEHIRFGGRKFGALLAVAATCAALPLHAATTWTCYPEITDGMTGAQQVTNAFTRMASGDTILVKPGVYDFTGLAMDVETYVNGGTTYVITNHLDLVPNKRDFTLRGDTEGHWDDGVVFKGDGRFLDVKTSSKKVTIANITFDGFDCGRYPCGGSYESRGGCIRCDNWTMWVIQMATNCVFRNCKAYIGGAMNGGVMVDCIVSNNWCSSQGGATVNTRIVGSTVRGNRSELDYGACYGHVGLFDSLFEGNHAVRYGGAARQGATYEVSNCTFRANSSLNVGGALYVDHANAASVLDCTFDSNVSSNYQGGAIYVTSKGLARIEGCSFTGNMSWTNSTSNTSFGGAVYYAAANATNWIVSCAFTNNFAWTYGGAVYNGNLTNCILSGNAVLYRGAGVANCSAVDCRFVDNVKKDITGRHRSTHGEYGGGDAYASSLVRCDCNGGMFWRCALTDCVIHDLTNAVQHCVFYEENYATNCLVTRVRLKNAMGGSIFYRYLWRPWQGADYRGRDAGSYVNCTFADNEVSELGVFAVYSSTKTNDLALVNCLFHNNRTKDGTLADISGNTSAGVIAFTNCLWGVDAETIPWTGSGNVVCADPKFAKNIRDGRYPYYMPKSGSPAIGAGLVQDWMSTASDLSGTNRVLGACVDIGCYESYIPAFGTVILFQ